MKEYQEKRPILIVGGSARAFLGEYMAGGLIIVLGRNDGEPVTERGIGSGIHGGEIYIRGRVQERFLGTGAKVRPYGAEQKNLIKPFVHDFSEAMGEDPAPFLDAEYTRIGPMSSRPFAGKYTWE
jgi:glutamate synthase domain-containing protein 3